MPFAQGTSWGERGAPGKISSPADLGIRFAWGFSVPGAIWVPGGFRGTCSLANPGKAPNKVNQRNLVLTWVRRSEVSGGSAPGGLPGLQ